VQSLEPRLALAVDGGVFSPDPSFLTPVALDNGRAPAEVGYFAVNVGPGGTPSGSAVTALGRSGRTFVGQDFIFRYDIFVDVGASGQAFRLGQTEITLAPTLVATGVVASAGRFEGERGVVDWRVESSFDGGGDRFVNRVSLQSANPFGALRVIAYLDEDVLDAGGDILSLVGSPGAPDFRAFTLDDAERIGFAQSGVLVPGAGLVNATYDGWAADRFPILADRIVESGASYTVAGSIDLDQLPAVTDPDLGTVFGPADVTTAFAWTVSPDATESVMTPFLTLAPTDPAAPGVSIVVDADNREPLTAGRTARLTFALTESGTDFTVDDVVLEGRDADGVAVAIGTLSDFAGSGALYTATFTPAPGVVGTATFRVAAGAFTNLSGRPNSPSNPAPIAIDTRTAAAAVLAVGIDGSPRVWAREFAYSAAGPASILVTGLAAGPARLFRLRGSVTLAADGVAEPVSARITSGRYQAAARTLTLDLDTTLPAGTTTGFLTVGSTVRPAARLLDADAGTILREVGGTDLFAAGYTPAFAARHQGGLRVAAGDADGDGSVDLSIAPGGLPVVGRAAQAVIHGGDIHRITIFNGTAGPGWRAVSVDVAAIFGTLGESGYVIALGDVFADPDGGVELIVAAGSRIAIFDILRGPAGPTIAPEPLSISDLPTPATITSLASGAIFDDPLADIVVASTTGTDRAAGRTTVTIVSGPSLAVRRAFAVAARVESGPGRRLVDVFAHGATVAVGDFDGDARGDLAIGAGPRGLGSFRVLANEFITAVAGPDSAAALAIQFGPAGRFAQARTPGGAWKPLGGPDYFTPGEVPRPMGLGFNAPVMVATAASGAPSTGARAPLFVAIGAINQTGNRIRRFAFAGPNAWGIDAEFAQRSTSAFGPFAPGLGLRLG